MLVLLVVLMALVAALIKARADRFVPPGGRAPRPAETRTAFRAAYAVVLASMAPLLYGATRFLSPRALLPADAEAHAWVAAAIARGVPHGWVDVCSGGFPLGPHYQSAALVVLAFAIKLGVPPVSAVNALGFAATVAAPLLLVAALRASGARAASAACGAIVAAWCVTPYSFATPIDAYYSTGLLSQVCGVATVLATARLVLGAGPSWAIPPFAALAIAMHTQVGAVSLALGGLAVLIAAGPATRRRYALALAAASVAGIALYLPGLLTMGIPLGWSKGGLQLISTFPRYEAADLFGGRMIDEGRAPVFTVLTIVACAALLTELRTRAARGALAILGLVLAASASGRVLGGSLVVEILAPLRAAALIPIACGAAVAVGSDVWLDALGYHVARLPERSITVGAWAVAILAAVFGSATRFDFVRARIAIEDALRGDKECGDATLAGYRTADVRPWLSALPPGRFVVDVPSFAMAPGVALACPSLHGLELASSAPLGASSGGPGTQVGVLQHAFDRLDLTAPGADARAESLGVASVLHSRARRPSGAWTVREARGDVELSTRAGTALIGVGCVVESWRGGDRALRDRLYDVGAPPGPYDDPKNLVVLEKGPGAVEVAKVEGAGCDASSATVREVLREPGAYEAIVDTPWPVDVVVRATYFPTWRIESDGEPLASRIVAPGFPSARLPRGTHRVVAIVSPPRGYVAGLILGALILGVLTGFERQRTRAARARDATRP